MKTFKITLLRGLMGKSQSQRATLAALGLKKKGQTVVHNDTPAMRGQILKVQNFVKVEVVNK
ncbi:MAG: 50S ribosomal protein L30 [Bdellovibrionaceae bacterium]|jgi:large subunit ribosomal protein L30|nr:50S ribosomal protein L30 [Pseudobdellovibrionaceae bacterium]